MLTKERLLAQLALNAMHLLDDLCSSHIAELVNRAATRGLQGR